MENKERNLLIWILTAAGFILLVLYSPVGSPDAYNPKKYFSENQGVNFFGKIANAPTSIKAYQDVKNKLTALTKDIEQADYKLSTEYNAESEFKIADPTSQSVAIPTYSNKPKKATYAVAASGNTGSNINTASYSVNQTKSKLSETNSGSGTMGGAGMPTYSTSRNSSNNNNPVTQLGFTSINLDMSLFSDSTSNNRQGAGYGALQGGTDPGTNPSEEPIPVGDGWWLLAFMAAVYALFMRFKLNKAKMVVSTETLMKRK